jgi:cytosine deaminase
MFAHMPSTLLKRATLVDRRSTHNRSDIRITDGLISDLADPGTLEPQPDELTVDLDGYIVLPTAVEPHAHLDKAFLAERIDNPTGDLLGAINAMRENRHLLGVDETIERAERAARLMATNGYSAVRTHADTTVEHGLRSIEALAEVKRRVADVIDVEIVALCGWPVIGPAGADQRALLVDALATGADLVGGCPHLEGDVGTAAPTQFFLQTATDHGVGIDLHTDETLDPDVLGLVDLANMVGSGFEHSVTASHCVSLGMQSESRQREIAELVATTNISVIALPHTNLFLQGRGYAPMPRGLTAVAALRTAGVNVAAGADNLQDPFNPVGRACPFETASLMIMAAHLLPADAWTAVSDAPRKALGLPKVAIEHGAVADLVAIRAETLREAIAFGSSDRLTWRRGVLQPEMQS